ncbi:BolA family protein [Marinospirillum insulare]|uniref:DNA-binding transcriptional regulator BolA n=1 Tax=Marinospirillum insulare TaxID=217169 RepID=A0ABQ5ZZC4_9GAMM|nr:BolA/IbaG family iron-sulfur metabolism protein [Marinospirillum insulare]GLR63363.1 DNA-binding transcriptional regulator BolA [Marinospirillum insulare]
MAKVEEAIRSKLTQALNLQLIQIENESDQHSGPPGRESHFKLTLVSDDFNGLLPVKRHQKIYGLLAEEMAGPVHALALHLHTLKEWQAKGEQRPDSPNCLGVGS